MGEFEKRMKEKAYKTTWHSTKMTHLLDSILCSDVDKILVEAKQEFPKETGPLGYYNRMKWFVRWFEKNERPTRPRD